jgi:hypothetical protein
MRSFLLVASAAGFLAAGVMSSIGALAAQGQAPAQGRGGAPAPLPPNPSTQEPGHRMAYEEVLKLETTLSNWNRWGANDERGTLNLVTRTRPGRRRA